MIEYKEAPDPHPEGSQVKHLVLLDGKLVGEIKWSRGITAGWHYTPKGSAAGGEHFTSLSDCKLSLEEA